MGPPACSSARRHTAVSGRSVMLASDTYAENVSPRLMAPKMPGSATMPDMPSASWGAASSARWVKGPAEVGSTKGSGEKVEDEDRAPRGG